MDYFAREVFMDKQIENINIEKNKELFEYEMTEVILKLKGEFASFSGDGTMFEDSKVTDEDLRMEFHPLQVVKIDKYRGEVPSIKKFPTVKIKDIVINSEGKSEPVIQFDGIEKIQIKDVKKEDIRISIPKTNYRFDGMNLKDVEIASVEEDVKLATIVPNVNTNYAELGDVEIIKRKVSIPKIKYDFKKLQLKLNKCSEIRRTGFKAVPRILLPWDASLGKVKRFVMPIHNIPRIDVGLKKEDFAVEIKKPNIKVDMPSINYPSLMVDSVRVGKIRINVPSTSIECKYKKTENRTELYHLKTNVRRPNIGRLEEGVTHKLNIDGINQIRPKPICIEPISNRRIVIDVPSTDITALGTDSEFILHRKTNVISEMPKVSKIKRCVIAAYKPSQEKSIEVAVPHFKNEQLTINKVEVKSLCKVELPGKPNVDEDISRIISLVINKQ